MQIDSASDTIYLIHYLCTMEIQKTNHALYKKNRIKETRNQGINLLIILKTTQYWLLVSFFH